MKITCDKFNIGYTCNWNLHYVQTISNLLTIDNRDFILIETSTTYYYLFNRYIDISMHLMINRYLKLIVIEC